MGVILKFMDHSLAADATFEPAPGKFHTKMMNLFILEMMSSYYN